MKPDEAREVVFPQGIPVNMLDRQPGEKRDIGPARRLPTPPPREELGAASTKAEGGLSSEAGVIGDQARHVKPLNDGENLLKGPSGTTSNDEKSNGHGGNAKESSR